MSCINIFEALNLRSEFEILVLNYKIPGERKDGTIQNLKWFRQNGHQKNRFREGYERTQEICDELIDYWNNTRKK